MMQIPELDVLKLDFCLEADSSVTLPPFLGSTLRGAFGAALKKVFCFVPHQICQEEKRNEAGKIEFFNRCWFYETCPYQTIFRSPNIIPKEMTHQFLKGQNYIPHPFILIAPNPVRRSREKNYPTVRGMKNFNADYEFNHFSPGDILEFSIFLFGWTTHFWAQILVAVRLMAEMGLGKENSRVSFTLIQAVSFDENGNSIEVFSRKNPKVSAFGVTPSKLERMIAFELAVSQTKNPQDHILKVEFPVPAAQKNLIENRRTNILTFTKLIKKVADRLEVLAFLYAKPQQKIDYRSILENTKEVKSVEEDLRFYVYEQEPDDYGQSEENAKQIIKRDVFTGRVSYSGKTVSDYLPILKAGEILHVGADISHGLGKILIS